MPNVSRRNLRLLVPYSQRCKPTAGEAESAAVRADLDAVHDRLDALRRQLPEELVPQLVELYDALEGVDDSLAISDAFGKAS